MKNNSEPSFLSDSSSDRNLSSSGLSDFIDEQLIEAVSNGDTIQVERCIAKGADPTFRNNFGLNSLHIAARCGYVGIIKIILETNRVRESVNELNDHGLSALHEAILADPDNCLGRLETIRFLITCEHIDLTIESNITDIEVPFGTTPIMQAVMLDDLEVLELLLQIEKVDLYVTENDEEGNFSFKNITMPSDSNILHFATLLKNKEIVEFLLKNHADLAEEENSSMDPYVGYEEGEVMPVYYAVLPESKEVDEEIIILYVSFMIANNTINAYIDKKNNLLHLACKNGWLKILDTLSKLTEVDFNKPNKYGHTALNIAQMGEKTEVLNTLREIAAKHPEKKIDPNTYNPNASIKPSAETLKREGLFKNSDAKRLKKTDNIDCDQQSKSEQVDEEHRTGAVAVRRFDS